MSPMCHLRNAGSCRDYQRCWFDSRFTFLRQFMAFFDGISHIFYVKVDSTVTISDKPALLCGYSKNCASALCGPGWCSYVVCRYGPFCALQEYFEGVKASSSLFTQRATSTSSLGPRVSLRSSKTPDSSTTKSTSRRSLSMRKWRNFTILARSSCGAEITKQVVCWVSVGQKKKPTLGAHQMAPPGQPRTSQSEQRQ